MFDLTIIIVVAASLSVILVVVGLALTLSSPRAAVMGRLGKATATAGDIPGQPAAKAGFKEDFLWVLGQLGRLSPRRSRLGEIQGKLIKADVMMRAEEYIGLVMLMGVIAYTITFLFSNSVFFGAIAGAVALSVPGIIVSMKIRRRSTAITNQLPEALNIIASGLRAGYSFTQALSIVVREMEGPLTQEFSRVLRENRLGKPMDDALNDLFGRIENDDLELLVTALLIQRQVGGNLAEVLDSISHTIRERVRIKGDIKSLTAEGKLSAIVISLLPPIVAFLILFLNPQYILVLVEEPIGLFLIGMAVIMQIIGILITRKIVDIDV